jgi:hypothetical protein
MMDYHVSKKEDIITAQTHFFSICVNHQVLACLENKALICSQFMGPTLFEK